ncbi:TPA: Hok/Gef family protein [Escherichia coli]|nr:Hok/Gef family protein [Escherichia coli]
MTAERQWRAALPQRTFLTMLIVVCVTILCFVWMVRDSLCGFRVEQGNTVLVATLAY